MPASWSEKYQASVTRKCLSASAYGGDWPGPDNQAAEKDPEIRLLLKLEASLSPPPRWAVEITRQIALLPAQGWAMPHCIEAICQNIGAGDPEQANPSASYHIGPHRLQLMADYAICLEGWLKEHSPETISARTSETSLGWRDWEFIARRIRDALGAPGGNKTLLVRRLLAKLRFWLRASQAEPQAAEAPADAGQYISIAADQHEIEMAELDRQIRKAVPHGQRWLELIDSAWPGAARIFHYIERMMAAIGETDANPDAWPDELVDVDLDRPDRAAADQYPAADTGRMLYETVLKVFDDYLGNQAAPAAGARSHIDAKWAERLARRLGEPSAVGTWLAGLARKRIALLATHTKQMV